MTALEIRIQAALASLDQDCRWELIAGVATECPDDVVEACRRLLAGDSAPARTLGADILGRLSAADPEARPAVLAVLIHKLDAERDPAVLASIVAALGHTGDAEPLARIVRLAEHRDPAVRLAVAFAIATISPQPLGHEARHALIKLSGDSETEVRDWSTFGLGTLSSDDGPDVRAALLARAGDKNRATRAEALFGLAVRRDPRAVPHLINALQSPNVGGLVLEAAAEAADPRLLPALWALQRAGLGDAGRVRRAIDRCSERDRPAQPS
jgi:HEAT repeat protein